jgi:hypothetical protein
MDKGLKILFLISFIFIFALSFVSANSLKYTPTNCNIDEECENGYECINNMCLLIRCYEDYDCQPEYTCQHTYMPPEEEGPRRKCVKKTPECLNDEDCIGKVTDYFKDVVKSYGGYALKIQVPERTERCIEGACMFKERICYDSDGGIKPLEFGKTQIPYYNNITYHKDHCKNSNQLIESYCMYQKEFFIQIFCQNGCQNGACISPQTEKEYTLEELISEGGKYRSILNWNSSSDENCMGGFGCEYKTQILTCSGTTQKEVDIYGKNKLYRTVVDENISTIKMEDRSVNSCYQPPTNQWTEHRIHDKEYLLKSICKLPGEKTLKKIYCPWKCCDGICIEESKIECKDQSECPCDLNCVGGFCNTTKPECNYDHDCEENYLCRNWICIPSKTEENETEENLNCPKGQQLENGSCKCIEKHAKACFDGNIYYYDGCGNKGLMNQACNKNFEACKQGECIKEKELIFAITPRKYRGNRIDSVEEGNKICQNIFGEDWNWFEGHDGATGNSFSWTVKGKIKYGDELINDGEDFFTWISVNDKKAECFNEENNYGVTYSITKQENNTIKGTCINQGYLNVNSDTYNINYNEENITCNIERGDTPCEEKRNILCSNYKEIEKEKNNPQEQKKYNCDLGCPENYECVDDECVLLGGILNELDEMLCESYCELECPYGYIEGSCNCQCIEEPKQNNCLQAYDVNCEEEKAIQVVYPKDGSCPYFFCIESKNSQPGELLICEDSCFLEGECYSFGSIKPGYYCSDQGYFLEQKEDETACENNFECQSDVCLDSICINKGVLQKLLDLIKDIFSSEE